MLTFDWFIVAEHSVKDDVLIVLGVSKVVTDLEVKNAMIKLLQDELGLEVLLAGHRNTLNRKKNSKCPLESDLNLEELTGRKSLPTKFECSTRRPDVVQRLKVTRKSWHYWLQRRLGSIRRRLFLYVKPLEESVYDIRCATFFQFCFQIRISQCIVNCNTICNHL